MTCADIDWTVFDQWSESTCECHCGTVFRSHSKTVATGATAPAHLEIRSRKPCPGCGQSNALRRVSSDPETITIGGARTPRAIDPNGGNAK